MALAKIPGTLDPGEQGDMPRTNLPPVKAVKIILVGDSTMAVGSGWAATFCQKHVKSSVACLDLGRGGRSTRSYRAEGSWTIAMNEAQVKGYGATYVLIQFGHNDQSSKSDRWTVLANEFPDNLRRYVTETKAAGAIPVLLTPLSRRDFQNGQIGNTLEPWAQAVRLVAKETGTALVDLNRDSAAYIQKIGPVEATTLAMAPPEPNELAAAKNGTTLPPRPMEQARLPDLPSTPTGPRGQNMRKFDYTHLGDKGALVIAGIVADDVAAAVPALRGQLTP
jgi:lysophospholipase L1-like esterase